MDKNEILTWLERRGTRRNVEGMARYGIEADDGQQGQELLVGSSLVVESQARHQHEGGALDEKGARDERNFVKKGVNWGLRAIGRRNSALNVAALAVAKRLALSDEAACRWVGKDALRELASPKVRSALARRKT